MTKRKRVQISFDDDPGMTEQSHRDACDINVIMSNYEKTGQLPLYPQSTPTYGDFSSAMDYHSCLTLVLKAQDEFMNLPGKVRAEFDNDPGKLLEAIEDPLQRARLIDLGVFGPEEISTIGVNPIVDSGAPEAVKEPKTE